MRLDVGLAQRLDQRMILAPRMIQSMEILQLPVMALQERIEHELQENPVLELTDDNLAEDANNTGENYSVVDEEPAQTEPTDAGVREGEQDFDRLMAMNEDWADHFNEEHRSFGNRMDDELDKKHDAMVNMASRPQSLQDYLNDQLAFLEINVEELELMRYLISHIDERGYLAVPLEEIARNLEGAFTPAQLEQALARLQKLDPPGIGARDYKECLLLQLSSETPHREVVRILILSHLEHIQHNRLPLIQKQTGLDLEVIQAGIEVLRHLNPKPGSKFSSDNIPYVVPDIAVAQTDSGEYEVKLLDDWTPSIYISRRYIELYRDKAADPKAKEFLKRKIQSAQWLIEAIEQRRSTLTRVTRAIIQHQRAFLDKGPEHIEPLKMQQIADLVGVHVTTVSRAVDDKWVQTPRGIFPLKRFFGGAALTVTGEEVAWETIKRKLVEIVDNEDKTHPLSDEDLVLKLAESGYPVARRTVTKYRRVHNIQSSHKRKLWTEQK